MKKSIKFLLLIAAALSLLIFAASCSVKAESVSLDTDGGFQTVYVKGQELNLSDSVLTVNTGKKVVEVPLNSKDVTVSGYDGNKIGKQTVRIEYGGAYTEVTVTVNPRLAVNGAVTDYLVGDSFDKSRGVLKITEYDGSTKTVQLSANNVTVDGFDSSAANDSLQLKVAYTRNGERLEGDLTVKIYAVEAVDFYRPNKITYGSHYEGKADASGGRFVIKGNGGQIRREIPITSDMISGLDLSIVNEENPSDTQILTVSFNGARYEYEVQLTYTSVSLFRENSEPFNLINWNSDTEPQIGESDGELAIRLMNAYMDMPASEKILLDEQTVFNVARAAMVYGFELWGDNIRQFRGVFAIEYGERVLYLESYEGVSDSLLLFEDKDSPIYTLAPLLLELIDMYGDRVIYENETTRIYFNTYPVMDSYELASMESLLRHTLKLYDLVSEIPDDWKTVGITEHHDALRQAVLTIFSEGYVLEYPDIYYLVSEWREGDDLFDMLYTYLYEADEKDAMKSLMIYGLPTKVRDFYAHTLTALLAIDDLNGLKYLDTTKLLYNYYAARDAAESVKCGESEAEKYFYLNASANLLFGIDSSVSVSFDDLLEQIRAAVLSVTFGLSEDAVYDAFIKDYVAFIGSCIDTEGFEGSAEYAAALGALFNRFVNLAPVEQYNLLATLNMLYRHGAPELVFDKEDKYAVYADFFTVTLGGFMRNGLGEASDIYDNLVLAMEVYANRFDYGEWENDFIARMDAVTSAKKQLGTEAEEFFEAYLLTAYDKYSKIRDNLEIGTELGNGAECFNALLLALKDLHTAAHLLQSGELANYNYFLASYERAADIRDSILNGDAPAEVIYAYYHEPLFEAYSDGTEKILWSCDYTLNLYRTTVYIETLLGFGADSVSIYDVYYDRKMDDFLSLYYGMASAYINKSDGQPVFDKDTVLAVLEAFKSLDSSEKALFYTLEGGVNMYGAALELFISETFTERAAELAMKLFALETAIYTYEVSESSITLETVASLLSEVTTMYGDLPAQDGEDFQCLVNIYSFYVNKAEQLLA